MLPFSRGKKKPIAVMRQPLGHKNHTISLTLLPRSYLSYQGLSSVSEALHLPREPTQTITSSRGSHLRGFGSLRWLRDSEHPTLDNRVQGP